MKFYYVYILRSQIRDFFYIGYTENLRQRLNEHNTKQNTSTKAYTPFELIHYEAYRNMTDAKRREKYLKGNRGKTTLQTMMKEFLGSTH